VHSQQLQLGKAAAASVRFCECHLGCFVAGSPEPWSGRLGSRARLFLGCYLSRRPSSVSLRLHLGDQNDNRWPGPNLYLYLNSSRKHAKCAPRRIKLLTNSIL